MRRRARIAALEAENAELRKRLDVMLASAKVFGVQQPSYSLVLKKDGMVVKRVPAHEKRGYAQWRFIPDDDKPFDVTEGGVYEVSVYSDTGERMMQAPLNEGHRIPARSQISTLSACMELVVQR